MKLTTNILIIVSFLFFGLQHTLGQCDGTSDIIQNSRNLELTTTTNINVGMGNSFTATCSGVIEGVSFWTYNVPGNIGQTSVTIELYRNPFSNSRVLMSSVTTDISFQSEGSVERYFEFQNLPSLVAGTVYGVRFINNEPGQLIDLDLHTGNLLAGGNMFVNNFDQSSPWSTRDLRFQIHYEDNVAPVANCRNITRALGADGTVSISVANINNNSTDADSGISFFGISKNTFDCNDVGYNSVTLFLTDQNGNSSSCQSVVMITDGNAPILTCPENITVYADIAGNANAVVNFDEPLYDDCTFEWIDGFDFLGTHDGKSYFVSQNPLVPSEAFVNAESLGGYVATVIDAEQNEMLRGALENLGVTETVMIGYNDVANEGTFEWHNPNTTSTYENWNTGEPNNSGGNEDYTQLRINGTWNDINNNTARNYILEKSEPTINFFGIPSGGTFPLGTTVNTFSATDAFGNTGFCYFTVTVLENPDETSVELSNGKLTITDIETDSDDQITLSNDGTTLTISNLVLPTVVGGPILTDLTTVTVPLANITNGIEFIGGNGFNTITFANDLTLTGVDNDITLLGLKNYIQNGSINTEGDLTISGFGFDLTLGEITANNFTINGVDKILDQELAITIMGVTQLQAVGTIDINNGQSRHAFGGEVSLTSHELIFSAGANTTFGDLTATNSGSSFPHSLTVAPGNIIFDGNVSISGSNSNLYIYGNSNISQTSGIIQVPFLILRGNGNTTVSLDNDNNIQGLGTSNPFDVNAVDLASLSFTNVNNMFLEVIHVNEFSLTAPQFDLEPSFTVITKEGTGTSSFNADMDVNNGSGTILINHNAGIINFNGQVNDFKSQLTYNGVAGTTTNINSTTTNFPQGGPDRSFTFGILNAVGAIDIGDIQLNILDGVNFSGASTLLTGFPFITGGPTVIQNNATITPSGGVSGSGLAYVFNDLVMNTGATFAPLVEGTGASDHDRLSVNGTVTLTDAVLAPIGGYTIQTGDEVILIDNDGTDAIQGMFDNLPEGSGITFGQFSGIITYTGGDGNDVSLIHDNINPIAICQNLTFTLNPGEFVQVSASQIDNGSSDNVQIGAYLLNEEPNDLTFTYDNLGDNEVTLTVLDLAGNMAQCNATITITSNATFPILISEYQPELQNEGDPTQTIEIFGGAGEIFGGAITIIEGDIDSGQPGLVLNSYPISGTFDANGLLTATVPNLVGPSHTIVLSSSFSGTIGTTNIDENDDGIAENISSLGILFDAISVLDESFDENRRYASALGGTDLPNIDDRPRLVFRDASTGDFYAINATDQIYDLSGNIIPSANFTSVPSSSTNTFGQINPALIPAIEVPQVIGELQANAETTITTTGFTVGTITTMYSNTVPEGSVIDQNPDAGNFMQPGTAINLVISDGFNPNEFITKWETTTNNETIVVPFANADGIIAINWGDGTTGTFGGDNPSHTYATAGEYIITATGDIESIRFNNGGNRLNILEIMQWGPTSWMTFQNAFYGCENLVVTAIDEPDYTILTSFRNMFRGTLAPTQNILHWNTNSIMEMQGMFRDSNFNGDISNWDVSNVFNMANMFLNNSSFNIDISNWNVAKVQNMSSMFRGATNFDQNLGSWDISSVTNMQNMFNDVTLSTANYDATLIGWATDTSGAPNDDSDDIPTTINFSGGNSQFCDAVLERQLLIDLYTWTINDAGAESNCSDFNDFSPFITTWQTTTDNESITIPTIGAGYHYLVDWGDGTLEIVMTGDATHTYATAGTYTVSITGNFPRIYFNSDESGNAEKIQEITQWGTIQWSSMEGAFNGCLNLNVTATDAPDLSNVTDTSRMFANCTSLLGNAVFNTWDMSTIQTVSYMFSAARNFNTDLNNWNVANVTNMAGLFNSANLFNGNISTWNTGEVINMLSMFASATAFEGIGGLNNWNVSKVEKMGGMFRFAEAFNQDLNNWNVANVNDMTSIFWGASAFNGNISNWNITSLTNLDHLFREATNFNGDLSQWNVSNIQSLQNTFSGATSFNTDLNNWNVSNVTNMLETFNGASSFNQPLDNWNVSNVSFMYRMFYNATNFNQDLSNWDVSLNQTFDEMLLNTSMSVDNYDRLLIAWANLPLLNNLQFGISSEYCLGAEAKQYIIDTFNWSFTDDGLNANCTNRFITTWETTTDNETITIPTFSGETYNYGINWGDGTIESGLTGDATHTYTVAGNHEVLITGNFPRIYFNNTGDKLKIQTVQQWGTNVWSSMGNAFMGCENMHITATDVPDLSNVTNMTSMFEEALLFNTDISTWDVSNVNIMDRMFYGATSFDQYLGDWDISNITSMEDILTNAMLATANYDNTLIAWATLDTGETQIPTGIIFSGGDSMFCASDYERQALIHSYNWTITDAGKTTDCTNRRFITTWKTESDNESITIPTNGGGYNYLVDWGDGTVDIDVTGNATHSYATTGTYTVSILGDFPRIYFNTNHNSQIQTIEQWGSIQWDSMLRAFSTCNSLDVVATDVPDLSNVAHMGRMFFGCSSLVGNAQFNNWNVSNVNNLGSTFQGAGNFNQPLNNWDVSKVIKFTSMFAGAASFDQSLADWDLSSLLDSNVANAVNMFTGVTLSTENYDATLIGWATLNPGEIRIPSPVTFGGGNSQYCLSEVKRQELIDLGWVITDGGLNCGVQLSPKVYLQGAALNPNLGEESLMRDDLRIAGLLPKVSPYGDGLTTTFSSVEPNNNIVDWVWVELRDATDNTIVIEGHSALLQRDGDIVSLNGTSALSFNVSPDNYYVVIKHRNHLGIMSSNAIALTSSAVTVDFTDSSVPTFGTNAQTSFGMPSGILGMWAGDSNSDGRINYSGALSDVSGIRAQVFNDPNNSVFGGPPVASYPSEGYNSTDINMDGVSVYSGGSSDVLHVRNNIFNNSSNSVFGGPPTSTYIFIQQLPEDVN
ncbi:BspA family leucine-rich repeat surface protein [uncultured Lacinutrix sp.]|uniref:BspA family leucine-rich repeat surface protein n=1 Tax=uncultured Lacinutrix sp. TaxID=574032 RepID=UPI002615E7A7|nr:BspA family leucine-rich repeat surface protein [uncultured Lacinutrix sp.]